MYGNLNMHHTLFVTFEHFSMYIQDSSSTTLMVVFNIQYLHSLETSLKIVEYSFVFSVIKFTTIYLLFCGTPVFFVHSNDWKIIIPVVIMFSILLPFNPFHLVFIVVKKRVGHV